MKNYLLPLFIVFLFSCKSENPAENEQGLTKNDSIAESIEVSTNENQLAPNDAVQENPLTIEDFPKKWFKLDPADESGEEYIINKYCEAETQQIWIEKEGDNWVVFVLYGQDGQKYSVVDFDAYEEERELYQVMYGSFVLENPDYPDMDVELYDYVWNKDLMFCTFNGFFQDEVKMVSEQNKDNYTLLEEDCDYLENQ